MDALREIPRVAIFKTSYVMQVMICRKEKKMLLQFFNPGCACIKISLENNQLQGISKTHLEISSSMTQEEWITRVGPKWAPLLWTLFYFFSFNYPCYLEFKRKIRVRLPDRLFWRIYIINTHKARNWLTASRGICVNAALCYSSVSSIFRFHFGYYKHVKLPNGFFQIWRS